MRYLSVNDCDVSNGPGVRVSLFVSGCDFKCVGCWNPRSWNHRNGDEYTAEVESGILAALERDYIAGLSVLGGEPLHENNVDAVLGLVQQVNKPVWMWTGYTLEEAQEDPRRAKVLKYVDTLVDGQFVLAERDLTLDWRGSRNQRVIRLDKGVEVV